MTGPRSGSRLYAASWASPTDSKRTPTTQTATPSQTTQVHSTEQSAAAWSGSETSQTAAPWTKNTLRTARPMPTVASGPPSSSS